MKLFQDKILIRKEADEDKVGSLFIVRKDRFEPIIGTVVECGPGKVFCARDKDGVTSTTGYAKTQVKVGDRVMAQRNAEYNIKVNNEWLMLYRETDIIGVLSEVN